MLRTKITGKTGKQRDKLDKMTSYTIGGGKLDDKVRPRGLVSKFCQTLTSLLQKKELLFYLNNVFLADIDPCF